MCLTKYRTCYTLYMAHMVYVYESSNYVEDFPMRHFAVFSLLFLLVLWSNESHGIAECPKDHYIRFWEPIYFEQYSKDTCNTLIANTVNPEGPSDGYDQGYSVMSRSRDLYFDTDVDECVRVKNHAQRTWLCFGHSESG